MDFFQWILIICLIVGGGFVLYSVVNFHGARKDDEESSLPNAEDRLAEKLSVYQSSVEEADEAINELNDVSKSVFKEFDGKYQELLFLYNLIEEKKQELEGQPALTMPAAAPRRQVDYVIDDSTKKSTLPMTSPKFANVLELKNKGLSIDEIAQQLNIGKGEVSLILNLGGGGGA